MMNYAKFEGELYKKLWAECAKSATDLDGVLIQDRNNKSNYKKMFRRNLAFLKHPRIFGEMGILMFHKQEGHKSKIDNRGKEAIFVGYSKTHAGDVFQFFDIATKQMKISRDVRWTRKFYADGNYIEISNYHQNSKIYIHREACLLLDHVIYGLV